ncbi:MULTISPECIES: cytochrome c [Vibrio]|uniref:C-type cytochrome n=2 Tax=Vibrio TaxID=662 RepID=A0A7X4LQ11_9VIBR|nr:MULTISPECIES: cytochrome c [Vibrio]MBF9000642.1 cytochrome c [Vibrio nitrifigilis]MZI95876.1 c-type cytochrome [Vibrio eleionomae]
MKTLITLGSLLSVLSVASYAASPTNPDNQQINQGEYIARASDCVACHTAEGGKNFAGGLAIESPFGKIYSTNITPSKTHGIGNYSYAQFEQALRHGVRADGSHLYPAMPYPDYAKLKDDDVKALYAYFMHGVDPVDEDAPKTDLSFPFNQRWGIRFWNWVAADASPYQNDAKQSEAYNRGAYLVQGPGHCGSCHTPRGLVFQEKGYDHKGGDFLSGGMIGIWHAPDLRAGKGGALEHWSKEDIAEYLATGRNVHSAVAGEMTSVVEHSLSYLNDSDLDAIATYLKTLPGDGTTKAISTNEDNATTAKLVSGKYPVNSGERLYVDNCSACHFSNAKGAPRVFPALDGNSLVNAQDPSGLIHVILAGSTLPSTPKAPEALAMPGFGWRLSDEEVAKLATFLRSGWHNKAPSVSADDVATIRKTIPKSVLEADKPNVE